MSESVSHPPHASLDGSAPDAPPQRGAGPRIVDFSKLQLSSDVDVPEVSKLKLDPGADAVVQTRLRWWRYYYVHRYQKTRIVGLDFDVLCGPDCTLCLTRVTPSLVVVVGAIDVRTSAPVYISADLDTTAIPNAPISLEPVARVRAESKNERHASLWLSHKPLLESGGVGTFRVSRPTSTQYRVIPAAIPEELQVPPEKIEAIDAAMPGMLAAVEADLAAVVSPADLRVHPGVTRALQLCGC